MIDFLVSLFWVVMVWNICRIDGRCHIAYLNRKFHVRIRNKLAGRLLLYQFPEVGDEELRWYSKRGREIQRRIEQARGLLGIDGIASYLLLVPTTLFVWIKNGFIFLNGTPYRWYDFLFLGVQVACTMDFYLGYFLMWLARKKEKRSESSQEMVS